MRSTVVIPVKRFDTAKSRLQAVLSPEERADLALRLFLGVVRAATRCPEIEDVIVVTSATDAMRWASDEGANAIADPEAPTTLAAAVETGLREAKRRAADRAIVLMSDLAYLERRDVSDLARTLHDHDVVIAPDRRRASTNAFGFPLARHAPLAFGDPSSFERHVEGTRALGQTIRVIENTRLEFDVDTPEDYALLCRRPKR